MVVRDSVDDVDLLRSLVELSNGVVSNQLDATNTLLTVFSALIALVGIGISIYLAHLEKKVSRIRDDIDVKAGQIAELDTKIRHNVSGLYRQLRDEENRALAERLKAVPQDIVNILPILLARKLDSSLFPDFKNAYCELVKMGKQDDEIQGLEVTFSMYYAQLFAQHFFYEAMMDDVIRGVVMMHITSYIECFFENDIIQATTCFCKALSVDRASFDKADALYAFINAINQSKHSRLSGLRDVLWENISPSSLLPDVLERFRQNGINVALFSN